MRSVIPAGVGMVLESLTIRVAAWLSGSALVSINEVALRRARLVPGWVTVSVCGWVNHIGVVASHSGQLSPSAGRKMSTGQSAVMFCGFRSKGRYGSFHLWINMRMARKTVVPR